MTHGTLTVEQVRKQIEKLREEREQALAKAEVLTQAIIELSRKRDELILG